MAENQKSSDEREMLKSVIEVLRHNESLYENWFSSNASSMIDVKNQIANENYPLNSEQKRFQAK